MIQHMQIDVIHQINKMGKKRIMFIPADAEKAFNKIQHSLVIKT